MFQSHTRVWIRSSRCLIALYGTGRLTSSWTRIWLHISNGMCGRSSNTMGRTSLVCMVSLGLRTHFGTFKYAYLSCSRIVLYTLVVKQILLQSRIPKGAHPLSFLLYADKTRLLGFGTAKAYPVVACCTNLPAEIRNGNGVGSGRIVGWLPIVSSLANINQCLVMYCITWSRSRNFHRNLQSQHLLTSNMRSGIAHFTA
jgi:hypothetical protein